MSKIIDVLNEIKQAEITAILTFMAHTDALQNEGMEALARLYREEAVEEMGHASRLAERIYFLGGKPDTTALAAPNVGKDLMEILANDAAMEQAQIERIRKAIKLAWEEGDPGTRNLLEEILRDEEHHFSELSQMRENLKKYGLSYLAMATKSPEIKATAGHGGHSEHGGH